MKNNTVRVKTTSLSLEDVFGYIKKINNKSQKIQSQNFDKQIEIAKEEHAKKTIMKLG